MDNNNQIIMKKEDYSSKDWRRITARIIALVLWSTTVLGFIAAGAGAFGLSALVGSWRTIAVVMAIVSLIALALYWHAFASLFPNKIGAIAVNIAVVVGVLIAHWPDTDIIP